MRATLIIGLSALFLVGACGKGESTEAGGGGGGGDEAPASAALTKERAQAIADSIELGDGWTKGTSHANDGSLMVNFKGPKNEKNNTPSVLIGAVKCMGGMCMDLTADAWQKNADNLKMKMARVHIDNPDLVFEIGESTVDGKKAISVYSLSYVEKTTDKGTSKSKRHSYDLYWHDGTTLVSVSANAGQSMAASAEALAEEMPKDDLKAAAEKALTATLAKL